MSHSQEPSYYEIALTNRQVLGFFVVLLLCVVGAFFSGIWLGKRQSQEIPLLAQAAVVSEPAEAEAEPLEELNFFTDSPEEATAPAPAEPQLQAPSPRPQPEKQAEATAGRATTLREDLERSQPTSQASLEPPRREEPTAPARQEPRRQTPPRQTPQESVVSETFTPPPVAGGYVIQVFSSPDGEQARRLRDRIAAAGYDVFVLEEVVRGEVMHRVRVGPYAERAAAERVEPRLKADFKVDTWVTSHQ